LRLGINRYSGNYEKFHSLENLYWMSFYRWGYGWNYWEKMKPRGYKTPTIKEQIKINEQMPAAIKVIEDAKCIPRQK
jgi:hypothetical protein